MLDRGYREEALNYLIFCSFEVGGLIYKMAETLNRHGVMVYYISLAKIPSNSYNSAEFHYGNAKEPWDLSSIFSNIKGSDDKAARFLRRIKDDYHITACLATGHKSYLLKQAGIEYKYWTYGADLYHYNKPSIVLGGFPSWKKAMLTPYVLFGYARQQKRSIADALSMWLEFHQLDIYNRLYPSKPIFFLPRFGKVADYERLCEEKAESKKTICKIINAKHFFFSSARHFWAGNNSALVDSKGNDVMLRAFARYLEISGDKDSKLILIKRGPDTGATEQIARKLGIEGSLVWIKEARRDDLRSYYQGASVCFGQFGEPILAYTAIEPVSCATPTASFFEYNNTLVPFYKTRPHVLNSRDPGEIAVFMDNIVSDPEYAERWSHDTWLWARENCSEEKFVESFVKEIG
jgi:glycosyltransferase involved in cell wall biosynthesis